MQRRLRQLLQAHQDTANLPPAVLQALVDTATWGVVAPHDTLATRGQSADTMYCLLEGALEVVDDTGNVLDTVSADTILGGASFWHGRALHYTLRAAAGGAIVAPLQPPQDTMAQAAQPQPIAHEDARDAADADTMPTLTQRSDNVAPPPVPRWSPWLLFAWPQRDAIDVASATVAQVCCALLPPLCIKFLIDEVWLRENHARLMGVIGATLAASLVHALLDMLRQATLLRSALWRLHGALRYGLDALRARTPQQPALSPVSTIALGEVTVAPLAHAWNAALNAFTALAEMVLICFLGGPLSVVLLPGLAWLGWQYLRPATATPAVPRQVQLRVCESAMVGTMLALGALLTLNHGVTPGAWLACMMALRSIVQRIETCIDAALSVTDVQRLGTQLTASLHHVQSAKSESRGAAVDLPASALIMHHVTYRYNSAELRALTDITLHLDHGHWLGVVSGGGDGATTLAHLAAGSWLPSSGNVTGAPCPHDHVAWLADDGWLSSRSVRDNIALWHPAASLATVRRAAERVGMASFVASLPNGYHTRLGPGSTPLSAGQRQALLVARLFVCQPAWVVIDNATWALHRFDEQAIYTALRQHLQDSTVLIMSRRAHVLSRCDSVALLQRGRLQAHGKHALLMHQEPRYVRLLQVD